MAYEDTNDPSVIITFPLVSNPNESLIAWTTTPWTLTTNLALAVNPKLNYVKVKYGEDHALILSEDLLPAVAKILAIKNPEILQKMTGADLVGIEYTPLFTYFEQMKETGCFKVYPGDFVTNDTGTGIVHCAPYGVDDFALYMKFGLVNPENPPDPIDENGFFNHLAPDFQGMYIKDADIVIIKHLKDRSRLINHGTIKHSYPFCWRSSTPLIYRPVKSWFIRVESFKEDLLVNNMKARWVP
jgi:isoleucyl-tRNA synthetase